MHVYIAPEPGSPVLKCCTVLLSLTQTCFHTTYISTPGGAYKRMLPLKAQSITQTYKPSRPVRFSFLWMSEPVANMRALQLQEPRTHNPSATSPTL